MNGEFILQRKETSRYHVRGFEVEGELDVHELGLEGFRVVLLGCHAVGDALDLVEENVGRESERLASALRLLWLATFRRPK